MLNPLPYDPRWKGRGNTGALAYRQKNLIEFRPSIFCGYGQPDQFTWCTGIYKNDSTLSTASGRSIPGDNGAFGVPDELDTYILADTFERKSRLASKIEMTWTFTSARPDTTVRLPLNAVRHNVQGLDGHNRARPSTRTGIPLLLEGPNSSTPQIQDARVEASTGDGKTWTAVPTGLTGGQWHATITNPDTPGFVTLRTTVTDADGNTAVQTIHRAYEVAS